MNSVLPDPAVRKQNILSFEDFLGPNSIDELSQVYASRGITFDTQENLLRQIAHDFQSSYPYGLERAIRLPNGIIDPFKIKVGQVEVHIYGVVHKKMEHHPDFFDELHRYMENLGGLIFAENGLGPTLFQDAPKDFNQPGCVIDINDHLIGDAKSELALGLSSKGSKLHDGVDRITPQTSYAKKKTSLIEKIKNLIKFLDDNFAKLPDLSGENAGKKLCDDITERFGIDMRDMSIIGRLDQATQDLHATLFSKPGTLNPNLFFSSNNNFLPEIVDLDLKVQQGKKLSVIELRSAYIAEFIREWTKDLQGPQPCHIVCGAFHSAQISYFLQNGSPEKIRNNAISQVAKAKAKGAEYKAESTVELLKTSLHYALGVQLGEILSEFGTLPGARWGVNRLLDIFGVPSKEEFRSSIK